GEPAGVGGLADQALKLREQPADFAQATFGGADDIAGAAGVINRLRDAGLLGAKIFAGDQAGRIVGAGVDFQTGAQPFEAGAELVIVSPQNALRDQGADVGVDSAHGKRLTFSHTGRRFDPTSRVAASSAV